MYILPLSDLQFLDSQVKIFLPLFLLFFISSRLYFLNRTKKISSPVFILCLILLVLAGFTKYFLICLIITLPYIVLFIAHYPIPNLNKLGDLGIFHTVSIYLPSPHVKHILVFFKDIQIGVYILCSFLLTIPIAYISWHFVESKALSHKKDVQDLQSLKEKLRQLVKIK